MVQGKYKLVVAQPDPSIMNAKSVNNGWKCGAKRCTGTSEQWLQPTADQCKCGCAYKDRANVVPCLFDLQNDAREEHDIAAQQPELLAHIWTHLNTTNLEAYGVGHSPASLLGNCNPKCAAQHYGTSESPQCGVPGC